MILHKSGSSSISGKPWISYKEWWRAGMARFCIYNAVKAKCHRHFVSSCKTINFHHRQFDVGDLFRHLDLQVYYRYSSFSCNHSFYLRSLKPLVILCLTEFERTVNKGAGGRVATTVNNSFLLFSPTKLCFCRKRPKLGKAFDKEKKDTEAWIPNKILKIGNWWKVDLSRKLLIWRFSPSWIGGCSFQLQIIHSFKIHSSIIRIP